MDFLAEIPAFRPKVVELSPFWWKTYGGYSPQQVAFFTAQLDGSLGSIYDPMSGQAFSLCQIAWHGGLVTISDLNPAPLLLATLRSPELLAMRRDLVREVRDALKRLKTIRSRKPQFSPLWLSEVKKDELKSIGALFNIGVEDNPFRSGTTFWKSSALIRLVLGLLVLSARGVTSYRATDNKTWLRQGGLTPGVSIREALLDSLDSWESWSDAVSQRYGLSGTLHIETWDATKVCRKKFADAVIVSPPYANRLDYSSLWAPETAIVSAIFEDSFEELKQRQMGTTVVKNRWPEEEAVDALPLGVRKSLQLIRTNAAWASERYYYPFFANYALSLQRSIANWANALRRSGRMVIFVRDTVRKDELFPVERLVTETAEAAGLHSSSASQLKIIRSHVGQLRQRTSVTGIHGLAQREWWLVFSKK